MTKFNSKMLSKDFIKVLGELKRKIDEVNKNTPQLNRRKKYLMLVDVETIGVNDKSCYDISYVITDMQGNIQKIRAYCVREVSTEMQTMSDAYYWSKFPKYLELLNQGIYKIKNLNTIIKQMISDIANFNVSILTAYNSLFDVGAIKYTCEKYNVEMLDYQALGLEHECLWEQATNTIMNKPRYRKFAKDNNLKTASGKYWSSTAESCYKYMINNLNLNEEHIGLYDILFHELEILKRCNQSHSRRMAKPNSQTWRKMKISDEEMED